MNWMPERYEELARGALLEITGADTIGAYAGETDEGDGAVSVLFDSAQPGYPGWKWTVSIAAVPGEEPTVLEAELMPGDGALLAPDWVPWSDRLAEYKAAQEAAGDSGEGAEDDDDVDPDDIIDDDDELNDEIDDELDEDDVLGNDVLHGGDLDGVDIDEPGDEADDELDDESVDDDESDEESDEDDEFDDEFDEAEKTY
ncbi:hypothetical protein BH11ACT4_BH11ACT4_08000 [soil metagenome]